MHGPRLHGFALLLTVGDRTRAAAAAGRAIAAGMNRADELRHPERAAAWLRARVLRELRSGGSHPRAVGERRAVLSELGVAEAATDAMSELTIDERAALVSSTIEGLDVADVATVLGTDATAARRRLIAARTKYLLAAGHWLRAMPGAALPSGAVQQRVRQAAAWAIGARPAEELPHD